ncbi:MAG: hypothetical protein JWO83_3562 [Caulobacteraceae bacterium]|nr:hypothetical protein [Caulobacteraceae bacterium]
MRNSLGILIGAFSLMPALAMAGTACKYSSSQSSDGCASANPRAAFQISATQFASGRAGTLPNGLPWLGALQSGQRWPSAHPWPWNAPGIDYPVGYDTTITLQDPAKAMVGTGNGKLPKECSYIPNPSTASTGGKRVYCAASTGPITISGFDFSLHGCVALQFASNFTQAATVVNNKFVNGPNCSINNASLVNVANASSFTFKNNVVIGNGATSISSMTVILDNAKTGVALDEYNYYHGAPGRIFSSNRMSVTNAYNFIEGVNTTANTGLHGEVGIAPGQDGASYANSYNVVVFDSNSQQNTTAFYMTSNFTMHYASADHNVIVSNLVGANTAGSAGGMSGESVASASAPMTRSLVNPASVSALLAEMNKTVYGTLVVADNYGDPSGSLSCIYLQKGATINTLKLYGNVSLVTGKPMNAIGAPSAQAGCK